MPQRGVQVLDYPISTPANLVQCLNAAFCNRAALMAQLAAEQTDAYRLFHGSIEGRAGLTVDRYGNVALVQAFHHPLDGAALAAVISFYQQVLPDVRVVYSDRSAHNSRVTRAAGELEPGLADESGHCVELGVRYRFAARHAGQDPWLFLDLRAGRRRVMQLAPGKTVLNLFAYTCGVGIAAAVAGAQRVVNIDFAQSALEVGRANAQLNALSQVAFVHSDVFAALRQLAGVGQPQVVRGKRLPTFPVLAPAQFDLVVLDPPRHAKSPFGVVDLVADYPALFKLALLATVAGGTLLCCNNVAQVAREVWLDQLQRCATKVGRSLQQVQWLAPEADFPSPDGRPPLKMLVLQV